MKHEATLPPPSWFGRLHAVDRSLLLATNRLPHTPTSNSWVAILSDLGRGVGWGILCGGLAIKGRRAEKVVALRTVLVMLTANVVAQGPLKRIFARRRPFHDVVDHIVIGRRTPDHSFPSGHTASSFAAATSLSRAMPQWAPAFLAVALGVGFSRVYLGHHYPSDVVGGALVGVAFGAAAAVIE